MNQNSNQIEEETVLNVTLKKDIYQSFASARVFKEFVKHSNKIY